MRLHLDSQRWTISAPDEQGVADGRQGWRRHVDVEDDAMHGGDRPEGHDFG